MLVDANRCNLLSQLVDTVVGIKVGIGVGVGAEVCIGIGVGMGITFWDALGFSAGNGRC